MQSRGPRGGSRTRTAQRYEKAFYSPTVKWEVSGAVAMGPWGGLLKLGSAWTKL